MNLDLSIHTTVLPHQDPEASVAFYRDCLGFEVRTDVGNGTMRWITVGPADQPDISIQSGDKVPAVYKLGIAHRPAWGLLSAEVRHAQRLSGAAD